jgi:hypothetical protein
MGSDHVADLVGHHRRGAAQEDEGDQQVIPDPEELEDT